MRTTHYLKTIILIASTLATLAVWAKPNADSPQIIHGIKWPNSLDNEQNGIISPALLLQSSLLTGGYNDLVKYVLPSPDQKNAGTCLYMSNTGVAEWWLNKLNENSNAEIMGPTDLSERHLVNLAKSFKPKLEYPLTDTILLYGLAGNRGVLNRDYLFTKGWYKKVNGSYLPANRNDPKAHYGARYNWIDELDEVNPPTFDLPRFSRKVIFKDPDENRWAVAVAPKEIANTVKMALKQKGAPIQVVYNHVGYWHSVFIVGYNDSAPSNECHFIKHWLKVMKEKQSPRARQVEKSYLARGGCRNHGIFYVRDSIYPDPQLPTYDYDPDNEGEEEHYSARIVAREYEWLELLANHITQIYAKK
jgi:hypothetical protein